MQLVPGLTLLFWSEGESWLLPRMPCHGPDLLGPPANVAPGLCAHVDVDLEAPPAPATSLDDETDDVLVPGSTPKEVSPTVEWTAPPHNDNLLQVLPNDFDGFACNVTALLGLHGSQFLNLQIPMVDSESRASAICSQIVSPDVRLRLLECQANVMADDEMWFHLTRVCTLKAERNPFMLPSEVLNPLIFSAAVSHGDSLVLQWCSNMRDSVLAGKSFITAACLDCHWIPVHCCPCNGVLRITTWDASGADHSALAPIFRKMQEALGFTSHLTQQHHRLFLFSDKCGAMSVAFLANALMGSSLPETWDEVDLLHVQLKDEFRQLVQTQQQVLRPWIWGAGQPEKLVKDLAGVLSEHGVPAEHAVSRAQAAIQVIGHGPISEALRQLKVLGNQNKFQYLRPNELQALIDKNQHKTVGQKKKSQPKKSKTNPLMQVDPDKLVIMEGVFRSNGQKLPQLQLGQVGPVAMGVVLTSPQQAEPFLRAGQCQLRLLRCLCCTRIMTWSQSCLTPRLQCHAPVQPTMNRF